MSLSKLVSIFIIILILFAGYVAYQFTSHTQKKGTQTSQAKPNVTIDGQRFGVEIAKTPEAQQHGLSDRPSLPQERGMLFVFTTPDFYTFWMKDMKFPLDIIYIHGDKIVYIAQNAPFPNKNNPDPYVIHPTAKADKVLEINAGLSQKYGFKKGDTVTFSL